MSEGYYKIELKNGEKIDRNINVGIEINDAVIFLLDKEGKINYCIPQENILYITFEKQ